MSSEANNIAKPQKAVWMAIYTKPRSEKKTAARLEKNGIHVYCPTYTTLRQWSDRKKKVELPVFSSYIFVKVTEGERYSVLQDPAVLNFVFWLGKPAIIRDEEIDRLRKFLEGIPLEDEVEVVDWKPGDKIRIHRGPFEGWEGNVEKANDEQLFVVMESIGAVVKVKARDVERGEE